MLGRSFLLVFVFFTACGAQFVLDGNRREAGYVLGSSQTVNSSYSNTNQLLNFYYGYDGTSLPPRMFFFFGGITEGGSGNQILIFLDYNNTVGRQVINFPTGTDDNCLRTISTTNFGINGSFSFDAGFTLDELFVANRDANNVFRRGPFTVTTPAVGTLSSPTFFANWTAIPTILTGTPAAAWSSGLEFFITGDFSVPIRVAAFLVNSNCLFSSNQVLPPCTGATASTFNIRTLTDPDLCPGDNFVTIVSPQVNDPCNPNPCNAATENCQATTGTATCVCKPGLQRVPGGCIAPGAVGIGCTTNADCRPNEICSALVRNPTGGNGICQCATGFGRNSTGVCSPVINPPIPSAICVVMGDPHFRVFDSTYYSFQGKCDYVLVRAPTLEIQVRLGECAPPSVNPFVSCVRGIAFLAGANVIFANESGVWNNGVPISSFPAIVNGVVISNTGNGCGNVGTMSALFPDGTLIEFAQRCAMVQVPGIYFNTTFTHATKGLCGRYDLQPSNDGTDRNGVILGDIFNFTDPNIVTLTNTFANSWQVQPAESLFPGPNPDCPSSKRAIAPRVFPNTACATNSTFLSDVITKCNVNFPDACRSVDAQQTFLNCLFDYCNIGNLNQDWILAGFQRFVTAVCNFGGQGRPSTGNPNPPNPLNSGGSLPTTPPSGTGTTPAPTTPPSGTGTTPAPTTPPSGTGTTPVPTTRPDPCNPNPCQNATELCARTSTGFLCICRDGLTRVAGVCVPKGQIGVGCQNDADCTKQNEICARGAGGVAGVPGSGICICTKGFVRNDKTGRCDPITPPPITSAICHGYGDPHYSMFDSQHWSTQAKCDYVLVRAPTLEIQVRQGECFPPTVVPRSCVKGVAYLAGPNKMLFNESGAYGQGVAITSFPTTVNGVQIKNVGNLNCLSAPTFSATFPDGTILEYGTYCLSVRVPGSYANSNFALGTKGLCGRFNGDLSDDGTFRNQTILNIFNYSDPNTPQLQEDFADSWKVSGNETIFLDANPWCVPSIRRQVNVDGTVCEGNQTALDAVITTCTLTVPENCTVDVQSLFFNCIFDTCSFPAGNFSGIAQSTLNGACQFAESGLPDTGISNPPNPLNPVETATTKPGDVSNALALLPACLLVLFALLLSFF